MVLATSWRFLAVTTLAVTLAVTGCGGGGRDAHEVVSDLEGTVSSDSAPARILQDVDLAHAPLTLSVAGDETRRYGPEDQRALEEYLHDAARQADGASITVVQEVVEETAGIIHVTLNLRVRTQDEERYVPVGLDLTRTGRRLVITHARVMLAR